MTFARRYVIKPNFEINFALNCISRGPKMWQFWRTTFSFTWSGSPLPPPEHHHWSVMVYITLRGAVGKRWKPEFWFLVFHIGGFWFWGKNPEGTFWGVPVDASKASLLCFNSKKKKKKLMVKILQALIWELPPFCCPTLHYKLRLFPFSISSVMSYNVFFISFPVNCIIFCIQVVPYIHVYVAKTFSVQSI